MSLASPFYVECLQQGHYTKWFREFANWTHAVTVTSSPSRTGKPRSKSSTVNATAHFVNVLNRRLLGRRQANQGFRIACAGVFGTGAYGDSPHVHLAFQAPAHHSHEEMSRAIAHAIKRTRGLGSAYDIQPYTSQRWFEYMLDHGTDGLMVEFITPAKH